MLKIKKEIFGLDISDHSIEALVLRQGLFGRSRVTAYARTILRGEVVRNGLIKNPQKLSQAIIKLLASAQPQAIKAKKCILALPEAQVYSTIFKFPAALKPKEIRQSLPLKAEEVIPFKSTEVYFDFKIIGRRQNDQEVFYAAVPAKILDSYLKLLQSLGLEPVAFDLESISLARALIAKAAGDQAVLLMDVGARTTNLNIFDNNGIRQSLVINIAGDRFTKAITQHLKIPFKDAEALKIKSGFDSEKEAGKILLILQNEFKRIIAETKKLMDFYQKRYQRKITKIILVGGSALLPKIDQYLAEDLGLKVEIGNPLIKITDPAELVKFKNKAILFTNVIGLALRGIAKMPAMSDLNLISYRQKKFNLAPPKTEKQSWKKIFWQLSVLGALVVVLIVLLILRSAGIFYQNQNRFNQLQISSDIDLSLLDELRVQFPLATSTPALGNNFSGIEKIKISQIVSGFLNVRSGAGTNFSVIDKVPAGGEYELMAEADGWYQIKIDEQKSGWILADFADKLGE
ncbi:MAG: hypothetical protein A3D39_00745 [Candidatus Buchananbacteria bacterium RIFCSPHIGHO2_02_FULL_39_17]|uniref:SH3b domain-containing protein n=2 Tax=Candidatus Buchananiibacteriota TaxID=1817903 RepID=A0A1G1YTC8_9BACT|nr:MAG: hypothetical protein A3D39_00745 [Candidatus Buchananbacteria bacterium RIFCSPHIGHO2_02_FULL_39_17]OGY55612.1 MAG: hypothetical protein A2912_05380 [Candidatus Buchananbacteria bacterium RIFCSPLOWO2_01_FULL_40_23b]